jgi:hypothetical protein
MTIPTVTAPSKKQRDFAVTLMTTEVDECGIPYERKVSVLWDEGVTPDWDDWLTTFNRMEGEEYTLHSVIEVTDACLEF